MKFSAQPNQDSVGLFSIQFSEKMRSNLLSDNIGRFRMVAFLEGCSFLLLGITMVLKYRYDMPQPNYIVGMAHGLLFILYVIMLAQLYFSKTMGFIHAVWSFIASLLPFGTFIADVRIFRKLQAT